MVKLQGSSGYLEKGTRPRNAKFTCEQVKEMQRRKAAGQTIEQISKDFKCHRNICANMIYGKSYKWCREC